MAAFWQACDVSKKEKKPNIHFLTEADNSETEIKRPFL